MAFEARILGPVEASLDGRVLALGSPKQRAVFALLVLNARHVVSTDRLVDELWGESPPESPGSSLQVYISRLRRSLGVGSTDAPAAGNGTGEGGVRLLRRGAGYQLDIPDEAVDAHRFADLVSSGRTLVRQRQPAAQHVLEQALALPRGPALADVVAALGPTGAAEARRLDDLRLVAQQSRLEALLAQGDAATAAADAAALVREHPLQEDLHATLMLALYRSGRQGEALQAYDAVRAELAEELGIDPGAALRELHGQMLRQDPELDHVPDPDVEQPDATDPPPRPAHVPRAVGVATGAVPEPQTSLVGRETEVDEVAALVGRSRLTALVGTGGAGKTRLALAAVEVLRPQLPEALWWVDVSALDDPASLPRVVAAAVGGRELVGRTPLETAVDQVGDRPALLVLDGCEHLATASAEVVTRMIGSCPWLRVLVTSREPLALAGEAVWPVLPLGVPTTGRQDLAVLAESPAVRLWCERAVGALRGFELTDANAAAVVRICRRLDGLPLAIELAAARLRVLSLDDIADALDEHLELLVASDRGVPDRHRNLRATLDWSYRLLSDAEQRLLAQLSVFHGGFTLDGAAAVRGAAPGDPSTLDVVTALVDRSLVTVARRGRPTRYRLLETVRSFAWEHLVDLGEAEQVSDRHLGCFLALAEAAEPRLTGSEQHEWLDVLDGEVADLIAALRWSVGAGASPEAGLRLVSALWRFWYLRGHYAAGRTWLDAALTSAVHSPEAERAKALAAAGTFAYLQCDYAIAVQRLDAALDTYQALDDSAGTAAVLQSLGSVARERADYAHSRDLHLRSRQLWQSVDRPDEVARSSNLLGFVAWLEGDWATALEECGTALDFFHSTGDAEGCVWSLITQGAVACYSGDHSSAGELLTESRGLSERTGYREGVAWSLDLLGVLALRRGDPLPAGTLLLESLRQHWELGDRWRTASVLEALADAGSRTEEPLAAGRLLGAARALRGRLGAPTPTVETSAVEALAARLAADLGEERLASVLAAGRRTPLQQVVARALGDEPARGGAR